MTLKNFYLILLTILLILIWGVSWPVVSIGLSYCSPMWYTVFRLSIAAVLAFVIAGLTGQFILPSKSDFPLIFSIGFVQIGVYVMLITLGLQHVSPGRSAIISYLFPYFVTPIAVIFFNERLTVGKIVGLILGAAGVTLLFSPLSLNWHDKNVLVGNGLLVLASMSWAGVMIHTRYAKWERASHLLLPWQLLISILPALGLALVLQPHPIIHYVQPFWVSILYSSILSSGVAYWILIIISRQLSVITTSLLLLAVPVVGLLSSAIVIHEKLTFHIVISLILIMSGLVCLFLQPNKST